MRRRGAQHDTRWAREKLPEKPPPPTFPRTSPPTREPPELTNDPAGISEPRSQPVAAHQRPSPDPASRDRLSCSSPPAPGRTRDQPPSRAPPCTADQHRAMRRSARRSPTTGPPPRCRQPTARHARPEPAQTPARRCAGCTAIRSRCPVITASARVRPPAAATPTSRPSRNAPTAARRDPPAPPTSRSAIPPGSSSPPSATAHSARTASRSSADGARSRASGITRA